MIFDPIFSLSHFSPLRDIEPHKRTGKNQGKIWEIYPGLVLSDSSRIYYGI